ncbi:hypothetical protein LZ190_07190 [Rhodovulum sulfidophilum]|nr:hypothetical protein [Rhodovulum sulfidophilum]
MPITDRKSAEAWLKDQPHPVQVAFAARSALRALPAIAQANDATLREIALPVLRAILTSGVAGTCPTAELTRSADAAATSGTSVASPSAAYAAAATAISSGEGKPTEVFLRPLWPGGAPPEGLARQYEKFRSFWKDDAPVWTFWHSWYEDMLAGRPVDWDFLRQVVLLPDEDWKAGPERIADRIEDLQTRIKLQRRLEELERQLAATARDGTGIGGNNPPEPIEAETHLPREIFFVLQSTGGLKAETERCVPDKNRIRSAIRALSGVLAEIREWTGGKLDWCVPTGLGYLALHDTKIRQVIDAAEAWLKTL